MRPQLPRVRVDDLKFLFDAHRKAVCHTARIIQREKGKGKREKGKGKREKPIPAAPTQFFTYFAGS
jgi:hypothetical protein